MISITALNGNPLDSDEESNGPVTTTKEALEEEAFEVYRKALEHIQYGRNSEAEEALQQLLLTDFTKQSIPRSDPKELPLPPGLTLRYLAYKNLAVIAYDKGDLKAAMQAYLEAVDIDMTDVSVWFKMGLIAQKLENYPLAKLCFEEGLKCSPSHKLCLDRIITLTYALNDYTACLHYIARALEKFYTYTKGLAFRDQIYRDHPMLRLESDVTFKECDPRVYSVKYDKEIAQKLINEALEIRERKREICKPKPLPTISFLKPFENFTWKSLGENLNTLYDYVKNSDPHISIACPVDLSKYWEGKNKDSDVNDAEKESSPTTVTSSSDGSSSASPSYQNSAQTSQSQEDELLLKKDGLLLMEVDDVPEEPMKNKEELQEVNIASSGIQPKGKRKRFPYESIDPSWKRRSTRVRNPGVRKPQDNTNYMELLRKFLPSSLLGEGKEDEQDDIDDPMALHIDINPVCDHTYGQSVPCRLEEKQQLPENVEYLKTTEVNDVKAFLESHKTNSGILDLYGSFLKELSYKNNLIWPMGLTEVYTAAFDRWRNHITQPNVFSSEVSPKRIKDNGWITLVYQELKVDKWQIKNRLSSVSPSLNHHARNGTGNSTGILGSDFPGKFFYEDSDFLIHSMVRRDAFGEKIVEFIVRTLWQHSKLYILEGDMLGAVRFTDKIATVLSQEEETKQMKIYLVNCHLHNVIYLAHVDEKLESLQRCQSLEEVHRLYEQGEYQRVVDLLILTFTQPQAKSKTLEDGNIPERHYQLLLLQDSLWKLEVYKDCLYWGEAAFNEALQQYIGSASNTTTRDWAHTIAHLLLGLDKCLNKDEGLMGQLGNGKLIRLTNNLIRVISLQMNASEFNSETNIATLTPWMLMYRLIHHEEKKILSLATKSLPEKPKPVLVVDDSDSSMSSTSSSEEDLASALPSSLMLLFTAHDYLGRRSWCTYNEGAFLHLIIDVMMKELHSSDKHSEDMKQGIEQCFYCLYGHPNKRTKVKHILEHNATPATLTWERAIQLFEYFQPDVVPEFDSYKTSTVSAEIENLLRRILLLVPSDEDPNNYTESVVAYIEGGTNKYPTEPLTKSKPNLATQEGFYLLGDYYFKNKEFGKASKFYILDIVVNPTRIDSWAGMALARSSQLEQRLISSDLRNDTTVYRKSCSALRCFKRALELDPTRMALWIEYGNMAYNLHAYASRQLKQQAQYNFPDDIIELLKNKREEMLTTAENCFQSANKQYQNCNEPAEVWLHHYMLGKIYEKRHCSPEIFLEHYRLAADHLHNEKAKYPKKILYHAPPDLAIEGLEVYYRTHTSILKFLIRKEVEQPSKEEFEILQRYLKIAEDSHFANFQELKESDLAPSSEEEEGSKKITNKGQDHDYIHKHHRNKTSIQAESSSESSDSVTIKELLNSIVTVVAERFDMIQIPDTTSPTIVLGDQKLKKTVSEAVTPTSSPKCDLNRTGNPFTVSNKATEKSVGETNDMEIDKPKLPAKFVMKDLTLNDLVEKCLAAILECHQRFPQHYKSLYRLAHYYCYSQLNKNLQKSREIILGGTSHVPIPSLFGERKNANFFNGIWRVPIDEIDRPGSFATHMFRSVILLIDILRQQGDHHMLTQLTTQLFRTPDVGKKYLRDTDRLHLAREAFTLCLGTLRDEMNSLLLEEPPPEESRLIGCLMDIYRTWQTYQKSNVYPDEANDLLEEAYSMYKLGEVETSPPVLEQAIRFCQSRQGYRQSASGQGAYSRSSSITNAYDSTPPVVTQSTPLPLIVPPPYAILDGKGMPPLRPGEPSLISHQVNLAASQLPASLPFSPPLFNSAGNEEFLKWYCAMLLANSNKKARHS